MQAPVPQRNLSLGHLWGKKIAILYGIFSLRARVSNIMYGINDLEPGRDEGIEI